MNDPQPLCPESFHSRKTSIYCVLLIALATLITFGPVIKNDFTKWDDEQTISRNERLKGPASQALRHYWTHAEGELYIPITYTAWIALAKIGITPGIFHGASVLVHMLSAILVFVILRRITRHDWAACAGALLFALHPLQIETVAWASGLKDLLCGLFALVAIWQYLVFATSEGRGRYVHFAVVSLAIVLAILAKPTGVVIPVMLGTMDVLLIRRSWRKVLLSIAPWFVLIIACFVWTKNAQPADLGVSVALWQKPLIAADSLVFYLGKCLAPIALCIDYGRDPTTVLARSSWIGAMLALVVLTIMIWRARNATVQAAALLMLIAVAPVLGFVPFAFQSRSTVADHYLYLSLFGAAVAASALVAQLPRRTAFIGSSLVLGALGLRSLDQSRYWKDNVSLFERAVAVNPASYSAYEDLAVIACNDAEMSAAGSQILRERGDSASADRLARQSRENQQRAQKLFAQSLAAKPGYPFALHSRATFLARFGHHPQAIADLNALVAEFPSLRPIEREQLVEDFAFLGWEYLVTKQPVLAIQAFDQMLQFRPTNTSAQHGKAKALAMLATGPSTRPVAIDE